MGEQVTWLHLSHAGLADEDLSFLTNLENLTMLRLDNNEITDEGVKVLEGLPHLESLNLYGTKVSGAVLGSLKTLPSLNKSIPSEQDTLSVPRQNLRPALKSLSIGASFSKKTCEVAQQR